MRYTADYLYSLLPAVYRLRDEAEGSPLLALLSVIAPEFDHVEDNITELYDNWFAETAQDWALPYIGDLLAVRPLNPVSDTIFSQRALVANTLFYRRRKGTLSVIERLARDVTGWPAHAVEYFTLLGTTQYLNHVRLNNARTPDIRNPNALELLNGPFEDIAHNAEVRRISSKRGRYNIPNIGVYLWRLNFYPLMGVTAVKVDDHCYLFSPLGLPTTLFNFPQETDDNLTGILNVPGPLTRRLLRQYLAAIYGKGQSLRLTVDGTPVDASNIIVCNLADTPTGEWAHQPTGTTIAVDPVLGRIAFSDTDTPKSVLADYCYGFSGNIGGGPYNRSASVSAQISRPTAWDINWWAEVIPDATPIADKVYPSLNDAITAWNNQADGTTGAILLTDSQSYDLAGAPTIDLKTSSRLIIMSGIWPFAPTDALYPARTFQQLQPAEVRPHIKGNLDVQAAAPAANASPSGLALNGLLFEGSITVLSDSSGNQPGSLGYLQISDCTLVPGRSPLTVNAPNRTLSVIIESSICGPVTLAASVPSLSITDSIIQNEAANAIDASGAALNVQTSTILGKTLARTIDAGNSIFSEAVRAERRQVGCLRFCFLGALDASRTPRRYRCQPDLAFAKRLQALAPLSELPDAERSVILQRLVLLFSSRQYGTPEYGQLSLACPGEITTGGEDGAEMGAFNFLKQPQREANLRVSLDEYLRVGLDAGIFFVT